MLHQVLHQSHVIPRVIPSEYYPISREYAFIG